VRLPDAVVEALQIKEGGEIEVAGERKFQVARTRAVGRHRGTSRRRHLAPIHLGSRFTQIG